MCTLKSSPSGLHKGSFLKTVVFCRRETGYKNRFLDGMAGGKVKKASNMAKILVSIRINIKEGSKYDI
jgi:hypothetical protein